MGEGRDMYVCEMKNREQSEFCNMRCCKTVLSMHMYFVFLKERSAHIAVEGICEMGLQYLEPVDETCD